MMDSGFVVIKMMVIVPSQSEAYRPKKITLLRAACLSEHAEGIVRNFFASNPSLKASDVWAYFEHEPEPINIK